jgi:CDGSH-type Zn-finger protein/uncharacterized Fe-S cluster protein YjdI
VSDDDKDIYKYDGDAVDVHWDRRLCIHIAECGKAQGELFVGGRKPWCQPDLVQLRNVTDVCERCPTGALTYQSKDGSTTETAATQNSVMVANHGPLYVTGDLDIGGAADDMNGVKFRAALCRCGHSKNKPFCDNSHEAAGFKDYGAVGKTGDEEPEAGGKLKIKSIPNGPLFLTGNFQIVASSGRVAWRGAKAAICRCGHSKNKPFCDGAHKAAGFEAD